MDLIPDFSDFFLSITNFVLWSAALLQLFWIFFFYARISFHQDRSSTNKAHPPVSIIIAARNEEDNLFEKLPFILEQDYEEFEVIVVNHQSMDNTSSILKAFENQYPNLRSIELERNQHLPKGKKLPLTIGIKGAKYNHLLFTDADCKPSSKLWLQTMAEHFTEKKEIVLGYGPYQKTKGLLNACIRFDTSMIALNYLSFAKAGVPYMGVGRNMAYTKTLFLDNNGFKSHYAIASGDDDLFIQEAANNKNYTVSLNPLGFCYSEAETTWGNWIKQKTRHYTTSGKYSLFKKLLLGIYPLSLLLMLISFVTLLAYHEMTWISLSTFILVALSKWLIFGLVFKKLEQRTFIWNLLIWDILYAIFIPIIFYTSDPTSNSKWR